VVIENYLSRGTSGDADFKAVVVAIRTLVKFFRNEEPGLIQLNIPEVQTDYEITRRQNVYVLNNSYSSFASLSLSRCSAKWLPK
jgi:hypothetical protein